MVFCFEAQGLTRHGLCRCQSALTGRHVSVSSTSLCIVILYRHFVSSLCIVIGLDDLYPRTHDVTPLFAVCEGLSCMGNQLIVGEDDVPCLERRLCVEVQGKIKGQMCEPLLRVSFINPNIDHDHGLAFFINVKAAPSSKRID